MDSHLYETPTTEECVNAAFHQARELPVAPPPTKTPTAASYAYLRTPGQFSPYLFAPHKYTFACDYNVALAQQNDTNPGFAVDDTNMPPETVDLGYKSLPDLSVTKTKGLPSAFPSEGRGDSGANALNTESIGLLSHIGSMFVRALTAKTYATARARRKRFMGPDDVEAVVKCTPELQFLRSAHVIPLIQNQADQLMGDDAPTYVAQTNDLTEEDQAILAGTYAFRDTTNDAQDRPDDTTFNVAYVNEHTTATRDTTLPLLQDGNEKPVGTVAPISSRLSARQADLAALNGTGGGSGYFYQDGDESAALANDRSLAVIPPPPPKPPKVVSIHTIVLQDGTLAHLPPRSTVSRRNGRFQSTVDTSYCGTTRLVTNVPVTGGKYQPLVITPILAQLYRTYKPVVPKRPPKVKKVTKKQQELFDQACAVYESQVRNWEFFQTAISHAEEYADAQVYLQHLLPLFQQEYIAYRSALDQYNAQVQQATATGGDLSQLVRPIHPSLQCRAASPYQQALHVATVCKWTLSAGDLLFTFPVPIVVGEETPTRDATVQTDPAVAAADPSAAPAASAAAVVADPSAAPVDPAAAPVDPAAAPVDPAAAPVDPTAAVQNAPLTDSSLVSIDAPSGVSLPLVPNPPIPTTLDTTPSAYLSQLCPDVVFTLPGSNETVTLRVSCAPYHFVALQGEYYLQQLLNGNLELNSFAIPPQYQPSPEEITIADNFKTSLNQFHVSFQEAFDTAVQISQQQAAAQPQPLQ